MDKLSDQQSYRASEFKRLKLNAQHEYKPTIRLETEHGETKRLSITVEEMQAITSLLLIARGEK